MKRLVRNHGGTNSGWTKRSSQPIELDGNLYEYHWYEHHGIGRFEIKRVKVREP